MHKALGYMATAALVLGASPLAQADEHTGYVGVNYAVIEQDDRFFREGEFDTGELYGRIGGYINRHFGAELRLGTTLSPKEKDNTEFVHNYTVSALLRLQYPMGMFTPYLAFGGSRISEEVTIGNNSTRAAFSDSSAGLGFDLDLGTSWGLNVEYFQLSDKDDNQRNGPSVGIQYNFY